MNARLAMGGFEDGGRGGVLLPNVSFGCSRANKQVRMVERKACFISEASSVLGGWTPVQRLSPHHWQSVGRSFYQQRQGATCRNSTFISGSHLEIGHRLINIMLVVLVPLIFLSRFFHYRFNDLFSFLWGWFSELWQLMDFPGGSDGKESACSAEPGFSLWVEKIPWRREWQPTPVFLPGVSLRTKEPVGLHTVHEVAKSRHNCVTNTFTVAAMCPGCDLVIAWLISSTW